MSYLEFWDRTDRDLTTELADPSETDLDRHEPIVRVAYRLWLRDDGRIDEVVIRVP